MMASVMSPPRTVPALRHGGKPSGVTTSTCASGGKWKPSSTPRARVRRPSLSAWKRMPDEVGIPRRPAELMTRIRVALMGKRSSGARPRPGPLSGENFLNNAAETDSWLLCSTMHTTSSANGSSDPLSLHLFVLRSLDCRRDGRHSRNLLSSCSSDDQLSHHCICTRQKY